MEPLKYQSFEQLKIKIERLKENLQDLEDTHAFTFLKTTVHIGAETAQSMQLEFEEECREYRRQIEALENELKSLGVT